MEVGLEDIWHSYDGVSYALKGINLAFKGPGVYVVIGPNDSGKTTLLKTHTFILRPSRGSVVIWRGLLGSPR
jgi:ABC-type multidrug transport system ATPase subunit